MRIAPEAMRALVAGPWEGNVREVRNLVESLVVLCPSNEIRIEDLPPELRSLVPSGEPRPVPLTPERPAAGPLPPGATAGLTMDEIERRAIEDALERTGGNRTQAAEMLGIGLRTLQRKLKEYRLAGRAAQGDGGGEDEGEG
jgi:DNA-binding NtrC family response regulator